MPRRLLLFRLCCIDSGAGKVVYWRTASSKTEQNIAADRVMTHTRLDLSSPISYTVPTLNLLRQNYS